MSIVSHDPFAPWRRAAPDAELPVREWLLDEGSLTRRLTRLADGQFHVTVIGEGWAPLRDDECHALQSPPGTIGWVREVELCGHGTPWVFARSVATRGALAGYDPGLETLGQRPLGELLFSDAAFRRQPIETCRYPAAWLPAEHAHHNLWARRSRFDRDALSLLVAEVFLPALWDAALSCQETPGCT